MNCVPSVTTVSYCRVSADTHYSTTSLIVPQEVRGMQYGTAGTSTALVAQNMNEGVRDDLAAAAAAAAASALPVSRP